MKENRKCNIVCGVVVISLSAIIAALLLNEPSLGGKIITSMLSLVVAVFAGYGIGKNVYDI